MDSTEENESSPKSKTDKKSIGHYVLGDTIGEGTFGKVRLGTHILTGEKVAVKILEKSRIVDSSDIDRVTREIHILKIIRHPNVIQLYEIIETATQLYLITEYASGGELFNYIVAHNRVRKKEACRFFQQIVSGIEYLHKIGVVHRDLKPENLLLDSHQNIKMVDFGLSNIYRTGEKLKTACGSPCYAAPEMIAGKKYVGLQVDIWSSGVILFALLCGYLPFEDSDTASLYAKILKGSYVMPEFLSSEAKDLIRNILNVDPNKRFGISDIRDHPWYNSVPSRECSGIVVGMHQIPVDLDILKQTAAYGFDAEFVAKCVQANKHNHATTTYYLLQQRKLREAGTIDSFPRLSTNPHIFSNSCEGTGEREEGAEENERDKKLVRLKNNLVVMLQKKREMPRSPDPSTKPHLKRSLVNDTNVQGVPKLKTPFAKAEIKKKIIASIKNSPAAAAPLPYIMDNNKFLYRKRGSICLPASECNSRRGTNLNHSLIVEKGSPECRRNCDNSPVQHITMIKPRINHVTIITSGESSPRRGRHTSISKTSKHRHNMSIEGRGEAGSGKTKMLTAPNTTCNRKQLNKSVDLPKKGLKDRLVEIYFPKGRKLCNVMLAHK